jgi:hypothetical protein
MTTKTTAQPKPKSDDDANILGSIAAAMKDMARERAALSDPVERAKPVRHIFTRGARAYLWYLAPGDTTFINGKQVAVEHAQYKLAIARDSTFPGDVEMQTFRAAFGVSGLFFSDTPQQWNPIPNDPNSVTRFAYIIRWFARE